MHGKTGLLRVSDLAACLSCTLPKHDPRASPLTYIPNGLAGQEQHENLQQQQWSKARAPSARNVASSAYRFQSLSWCYFRLSAFHSPPGRITQPAFWKPGALKSSYVSYTSAAASSRGLLVIMQRVSRETLAPGEGTLSHGIVYTRLANLFFFKQELP